MRTKADIRRPFWIYEFTLGLKLKLPRPRRHPPDAGAERVEPLVDALVAALDLPDVVDRALCPSAHSAAISIAMPARMSGDSTASPRSWRRAATTARCGSHSTMRAPMPISLSTKNSRDSNIFSCIRIMPSHCVAVTIAIDITSAGKRRPGLVLELRHVAAEVGADPPRLLGRRRSRSSPSIRRTMPSRSKPSRMRAQVLDARAASMRSAEPRDGGEPDERSDLDVIGADRVRGAAERPPAVRCVRRFVPMPSIVRAQRDEETARGPARAARDAALRRTVVAVRGDRRHQGVLGAGDARLVEEDVGAAQARGSNSIAVVRP